MCKVEPPTSPSSEEQCWICLESQEEGSSRPLARPCDCPRHVHMDCLARWCLQQAGRKEERHCRFCSKELPDWKSSLTPQNAKARQVDPIMVVTMGGQAHRIRVKQGPEGQEEFRKCVRDLFNIPEDVEFECTFRCKAPASTDIVQLEGMASYDAATHCASVMAAQRVAAAAGAAHPSPARPPPGPMYEGWAPPHPGTAGPDCPRPCAQQPQHHHHHSPHGGSHAAMAPTAATGFVPLQGYGMTAPSHQHPQPHHAPAHQPPRQEHSDESEYDMSWIPMTLNSCHQPYCAHGAMRHGMQGPAMPLLQPAVPLPVGGLALVPESFGWVPM